MKWHERVLVLPIQILVVVECAALTVLVSPLLVYERLFDAIEPAEPPT